ncbi:hypothetical protein CHLRE_06g266250v5 [Chlamydomonas reinhardtii]|uniref:Protein kinase domain-containing protein n=1 Tax=Chlamydomonas reinhardtii TaxID=3055 RepID=A0A2K3DN02_CHLRE|nr:uncharacterized protein CHLRE_06g266250v5 [Chlamydomonas reinhardtii]PNW81919.1 hypothetical protein CHLRE_06g266250v5 [Chlamydomonas reinhardtii]
MLSLPKSTKSSLGRLGVGLGVGLVLGVGVIGFLRHRRNQAAKLLHLQQERIVTSSVAAKSSPAPDACASDCASDEARPAPCAQPDDCVLAGSAAALDDCAESRSNSSDSSDSDGEAPSPSGRQSLATFLARLGLERCEPVQELGRGGFGRVQAVNITLPGGGVIKAVRKEIFRRTDGLSRTELLQQEVAGTRAAAGCASAVQLLGYTEPQTDDDPHELLLSYVPGMTLSAYLDLVHRADVVKRFVAKKGKKGKKGKTLIPRTSTILSTPLLKQLAISVLTAVNVMHNNNMCHGDIKSDNVYVNTGDADGVIHFVLGDFGSAEPTDSEGMLISGAVGGSRATAAPEQRVHLAGGTPACGLSRMIDMASVGLLLAEAAQFRPMPTRLWAYSLFEDDLDEWVPEGCRDLCAQLLAPSPSDRPSAKEALAHWWLNE